MDAGGRAWRGWFPFEGELTSGRADRKEGIYFGAELGPDDPRVQAGTPLHGPNLFPAAPPELRAAVLELPRRDDRARARRAARPGARPGARRRLVPTTTSPPIRSCCSASSATRPRRGSPTPNWGVAEHTDYGLLTILRQDDRGGLEVHAPDGWIEAPPIPGTFVCNLGDMLERMTGGRYRSTPHRVRNRSDADRLSFPFFFDPAWDAEVLPVPLDGEGRRRGPRPLGRRGRVRVRRHLRRVPARQGRPGLPRPQGHRPRPVTHPRLAARRRVPRRRRRSAPSGRGPPSSPSGATPPTSTTPPPARCRSSASPSPCPACCSGRSPAP